MIDRAIALPTVDIVPVPVGKVSVAAPFVIVDITGAVNVLFVSVSVVALPTKVSVPVGIVKTAVPLIAVAVILQVPEVEPVKINPPAGNVMPVVPSKSRLMLITPSTHPKW